VTEPDTDALIASLEASRAQFLELVASVRPDLHRYCARMTGSLADGEDVVQDTLARAYFQLSELSELPPLRPWLFRIAHNRAIDQLRRNAHRASAPLEEATDTAGDPAAQPEHALAHRQAVQAAVSSFVDLPATQRACVILKDVLDESLDDIGVLLDMKLAAVKSVLHRGRAALRERALATAVHNTPAPSANVVRYARLFNARDWDGIRSLLAADARLDLVSRRKLQGRDAVGVYFTNYDRIGGWRLAPGRLDGGEVLLVWTDGNAEKPAYFVQLEWDGALLHAIRDFRYVPYILQDFAAAG
jgi:RNA polymerase sigma factor (sigma-70 family)